MKIKFRKYEGLLVTLLVLMALIRDVFQYFKLIPVYIAGFRSYLITHPYVHFDIASSLFLPRVGGMLLVLLIYCWINLLTIPRFGQTKNKSLFTYLLVLLQIPVLSYLLAIGVNTATYYAHPAWNNYGEFSFFAAFGYNETPLTDLWAGFERALIFVVVYGTYAIIREYVTYRIENSGIKSNYRILIANQATIFTCIFWLLPALVSSFNLINDESFFRVYFVFVPSAILVYLANTYWFFPKYTAYLKRVPRLVVTTAFFAFPFIGLISHLGIGIMAWPINWLIQLLIITPITWILYLQRKDKIKELRGAEIALSESTAKLQFLRSQINPHFLFNALNTLYGTALVDGSKRTANGIQMLGDMMRFMLDDNHLDFIPLDHEINYLRNYIALQKLRIQDTGQISISEKITVDDCPHQIIPMLLIPFVENAFKHGIDLNQLSWINIVLICNNDSIHLKVRNSLHSADENDPERKHTGIGLQNVKERLELFYEGHYQLSYTPTEKEFIVELIIEPKSYQS